MKSKKYSIDNDKKCWDQDPCPEDLHADALLHVSVSVKRIFLIYLIFNCAYILLLLFTGKCINFYQKCGNE